ncbi:hypothetical protein [Acinetobacter sp.]|uniref:hypothetical protein n=1 Tax=Acinetobacter sp. TaxID=472 RepID=UPI00388DDBA9
MQYFNIGDHVRYKEAAIEHYDTEVFGAMRGLVFIVDSYMIEDGHELKDYVNLRCLNHKLSAQTGNGTHHSELELVAEA